jgi:hypothetical protein
MASQEWHWEQGTKYAAEGIKTMLLLNGAAAIALMTFATNTQKVSSLLTPLIAFVIGAGCSAFAFFAAYMTQLEYGNAHRYAADSAQHKAKWKRGQFCNQVAALAMVASVVAFGFGIYWAASVLSKLAAR